MSELEREIVERTRSSGVEAPQIALAADSVKAVAAVPVQFALSPEKEAEQSEQTTLVEQQHQVDAPIVPPSITVSSPNETSSPSVQLKSPTGMPSVPPVPLKSSIAAISGFTAPTFQFKSASIEEAMEEQSTVDVKIKADPTGAPSNSSSSSNGLPGAIQAKMEGAMGADFSNVNIHKESHSATEVGALAYAQGNDVHFAPGQYNPESTAGQELIGHELAHVVQQRQGRVQATTQAKGLPVNDDKGLEAEADAMGSKAAQMKLGEVSTDKDTNSQQHQDQFRFPESRHGLPTLQRKNDQTIQLCGRSAPATPFAPPIGKNKVKLKGNYGEFDVDSGVSDAGKSYNYSIRIDMIPNEKTAGSKQIGFIQTVRRSPGPGKAWSTKATDQGMSKERAARATKEGWRVDRADAKADKTPFYGMSKGADGKIAPKVFEGGGTNAGLGNFGGANPYLEDVPFMSDPGAIEFTSTAMDTAAGIAYDAVHWGYSYDTANSHYKEIVPTLIPANDALLKSRDAAINKWNDVDGATGSGVDKVPEFHPPIGIQQTDLKGTHGDYSIKHGLLLEPTAVAFGEYEIDIEMTPNRTTKGSRLGFNQAIVRSDDIGTKGYTNENDKGMTKDRAGRATGTGWRVDRADPDKDKTSFYGMHKTKSGKLKSNGNAKLGSYKGSKVQMYDRPSVIDGSAAEFLATVMDINSGIKFGAIRWGFSYASSERRYFEIVPTIINEGDAMLKNRDDAMAKWNEVETGKGTGINPVPGI